MSSVLSISDAASLAMHAMVFLAARANRSASSREIALELNASGAHLSKVLQRLAKVGLLKSMRGPRGGFRLGRPPEQVPLLEVYESIEGPLQSRNCLLSRPVCVGDKCILGGLLETVNELVRGHLTETKLSQLIQAPLDKNADA